MKMKTNVFVIAACAILLSTTSLAYSATGPYVGGNIGIAIPVDSDVSDSTLPGISVTFKSKTGIALGAEAGYNFGIFRLEGEIAYQRNDLDKATFSGRSVDLSGNTSSVAFLCNGYFDFVNKTAFTPFITAGIGFARVSADIKIPTLSNISESDDDTVFAYQVGAGVGYAVNQKVSIDLKYRYFGTSDPKFDTIKAPYSSHNIYLGMRYNF
jgi:outer membrane autotransporter protein